VIAEEHLVVDSSVVVKWFVEEELRAEALSLLAPSRLRVAPQFLTVEVANVLLKKVRRGETTLAYAEGALSRLSGMLNLVDISHLVSSAFSLAAKYQRTSYDALYVVLALDEGCRFVTADERLYNALRPHLPETMVWLRDVPVRS
jgi:predicted nucleic acid-binding protein